MKKILVLGLVICSTLMMRAEETYITKTGEVTFNSTSPIESFSAKNNACSSIIKTETGEVAYQMNIKGFEFSNHSMQEHFNEKYMESDKFPKAVYKGKISNLKDINFSKDGVYSAKLSGNMTIHGVTKPLDSEAKITISGKKVSVVSNFQVLTADYNIEIPSMVKDKIAKEIKIIAKGDYQPKS